MDSSLGGAPAVDLEAPASDYQVIYPSYGNELQREDRGATSTILASDLRSPDPKSPDPKISLKLQEQRYSEKRQSLSRERQRDRVASSKKLNELARTL